MLCGALQFELRTFDTLIVGTITEPLEYHFDKFMKKETTGRKDEQADILQEDENKVLRCKVCIDLYSLMKHFISCIFNTSGMRKKYSI